MSEYAERVEVEEVAAVGQVEPDDADLLSLLEERVQHLVERYQEMRRQAQQLRGELAERDSQIAALSGRVETLEQLKVEVGSRVERLISQVDHMERRG